MSPDDAVATFLERVGAMPFGVETVSLDVALGRILARPIAADSDYPDADRSAMDGFAIDSTQTPGRFTIAGEIAMGRVWDERLAPGAALEIPTGGVLPEGADAVVPIENVVRDGTAIDVGVVTKGENVSPRAGDMRAGEAVLRVGMRLGSPHIGVLATLGVARVDVYRKPRFAIVSSGDELIDVGARPRPGQIRDSNRYAIAAALSAMGADAVQLPTVGDEPGALESALRDALVACDGVVVSGGSSVGERDRTPAAIEALGEPGVVVHGLRVKPGKPTVMAAIGGKPVFGLPGNPTSALVILQAVLPRVLGAYLGATPQMAEQKVILAGPVHSRIGWTWYVPVTLQHEAGDWTAHPLPLRSSSVSLAARADGFIVVPEAAENLSAGMNVMVTRFL